MPTKRTRWALLMAIPLVLLSGFRDKPTSSTVHSVHVAGKNAGMYCNDHLAGEAWLWQDFKELGDEVDLELFERRKRAAKPNTVLAGKKIPSGGITQLMLDLDLCAVVVEQAPDSQFHIDYVGMDQPEDFLVKTSVRDSLLTIDIKGRKGKLYYTSTAPRSQVNTVRIGIPKGILTSIQVVDKMSNMLVYQPDVAVSGSTHSGLLMVTGDTIYQPVTLSTVNGVAAVQSKAVRSPVDLAAINGQLTMWADSVVAPLNLDAGNGLVALTAKKVKTARLQVKNGVIDAKVESVGSSIWAKSGNGSVNFVLGRRPDNLKLEVESWHPSLVQLPPGWKNGSAVGAATATLHLESKNGPINLEITPLSAG